MGLSNTAKGLLRPVRNILEEKGLGINAQMESVNTGSVNIASGGIIEGVLSQAVTHGLVLADDGKLYESVQAAENNATDWMFIGPGSFDEPLVIDTTDLTVVGSGKSTVINGGDASDAIRVEASNVTVKSVAGQTTIGAGKNIDAFQFSSTSGCVVYDFWAIESDRHGVNIGSGSTNCRAINIHCESANIIGNGVGIFGDENIVDDVIGSVNDTGAGNSVGETA
jgi:hypothetical protein